MFECSEIAEQNENSSVIGTVGNSLDPLFFGFSDPEPLLFVMDQSLSSFPTPLCQWIDIKGTGTGHSNGLKVVWLDRSWSRDNPPAIHYIFDSPMQNSFEDK